MASKLKQFFTVAMLTTATLQRLMMKTKKHIDKKTASNWLQRHEQELAERLAPVVNDYLYEHEDDIAKLCTPWPTDRVSPADDAGFRKLIFSLDKFGEYPEDVREDWKKMFEEEFDRWCANLPDFTTSQRSNNADQET